jgi:hypothetical protein
MSGNVSDEFFIFFRGPKTSLNLLLIAARMLTHAYAFLYSYVAFLYIPKLPGGYQINVQVQVQ